MDWAIAAQGNVRVSRAEGAWDQGWGTGGALGRVAFAVWNQSPPSAQLVLRKLMWAQCGVHT